MDRRRKDCSLFSGACCVVITIFNLVIEVKILVFRVLYGWQILLSFCVSLDFFFFLLFFLLLYSFPFLVIQFCIIKDPYVSDPWNSQKSFILCPERVLHLMGETRKTQKESFHLWTSGTMGASH